MKSLERVSFMSVIDYDDLGKGARAMPLNLPEFPVSDNTRSFKRKLATGLLIGHSTNIDIGDPSYRARNLFRFQSSRRALSSEPAASPVRHMTRSLANFTGNGTINSTCGGELADSPCYARGIGCRPSPDVLVLDSVDSHGEDFSWFSLIDVDPVTEAPKPFGFITLPYLPYFSNCEGYDSFVTLAKLMEAHPACRLEGVRTTVWIDQYPWKDQFSPIADTCSQTYDDVCPNEVVGLKPDPFFGIFVNCYFEESIYQVGSFLVCESRVLPSIGCGKGFGVRVGERCFAFQVVGLCYASL